MSRLGKLDLAFAAFQKLHAEFSFQSYNLTTERRLSDMQTLGGGGNIAFFGNNEKVLNVFNIEASLCGFNGLKKFFQRLAKFFAFCKNSCVLEKNFALFCIMS